VDQGAGELEAALHAAGQVARLAAAHVPELDQLEDLAGAAMAGAPQDPEQRRHEVDVLAGVRSGYSMNCCGM
jgi:hypothetical protein